MYPYFKQDVDGTGTGTSPTRFLQVLVNLDLADLSTIKTSAETFLAERGRLNVLFNNKGIPAPPQGIVNGAGLLHPILAQTAETAPASSVRVVWVSSNSAEIPSPQNGIDMSNLDYHVDKSAATKSGIRKAGNIFHSSEFARRSCHEGIIIVSLMPGALNSDLKIYGTYTEAFAGLGLEVNEGVNGAYDVPWGRFYNGLRKDLGLAMEAEEKGGTGIAKSF